MTGVSSLNIVVQQGGSVQEMLHPKQHSVEHSQMVAAQQEAIREADVREKVPESEDSGKVLLNKDRSRDRDRRKRLFEEEKKRRKAILERALARTGKLLDTVA